MASSLAEEACDACTSEDEPLTEAEYAEYVTEIDDDVWEVVNDHHFEAEYPFGDFRDTLEFTYETGNLLNKSGITQISIFNGARCEWKCGHTKSTD